MDGGGGGVARQTSKSIDSFNIAQARKPSFALAKCDEKKLK